MSKFSKGKSGRREKTVLTFGTFDLLHEGHKFFLREAKQYGDRLIVIIARDKNVARIKGKYPHDDEDTRRRNVAAVDAVHEARLGYEDWAQHQSVLQDIQPDVVCLGYDQRGHIPAGSWRVVRLAAYLPEKYKSSLLLVKQKKV